MNYTWYVKNEDSSAIQFCVVQSGGYNNCATINGNSTQTFTIPDMIIQIYGNPVSYYVYYSSSGVKTGTQSLPPSGSTITVPPFQGCIPLLTQGQGYPPIIPCQYPGIIFLKSESTPSMFVENYGAVQSGFEYGYGIAGGPLALATGPNWQYYRQYPNAKVYLIGNWAINNGNYVDQDSGKTYCGCSGASVYIIPNSALPGPSGGTGSGGSTSGGSSSGGSQTNQQTTGILNVANQCSSGVVVNAGGKTAYVPPYRSVSLEVPIPTNYTLISEGQTVGQGTIYQSGQYVSPQSCPSTTPGPTPGPTPTGGTTTTTTTPTQIPLTVLLALVILGAIALGSNS